MPSLSINGSRIIISCTVCPCSFIADAALHHKCKELGINDKGWNFKKRIGVLSKRGVIHPDEAILWNAKLNLRDSVAHQTHRPLDYPPNEFSTLQTVADDISRLFIPRFAKRPYKEIAA